MCKFVGKELRETRAHLDAARGGIHAILYPEIYTSPQYTVHTCDSTLKRPRCDVIVRTLPNPPCSMGHFPILSALFSPPSLRRCISVILLNQPTAAEAAFFRFTSQIKRANENTA